MLLYVSISKTKKFFQKTLNGFKSFLSRGSGDHYQRLPKSPPPFSPFPHMNLNQSYDRELDKFYTDFTSRWDEEEKMTGKKRQHRKKEKEEIASAPQTESFAESRCERNFDDQVERRREDREKNRFLHEGKREDKVASRYKGRAEVSDTHVVKKISCCKGEREGIIRGGLVGKKLKEMEMVDKGNIEHVLDIEEVLHYYSRLTCPAYLDIVDKFFMEIHAEIISNGRILP